MRAQTASEDLNVAKAIASGLSAIGEGARAALAA
jgi:hypothetical protein